MQEDYIFIKLTESIMKKLFIASFLFSFLLAEDSKINLKIDGMQCAYSCAGKVSQVVQSIKGVEECEVDFATGTAVVKYDEKKVAEVLSEKVDYKYELAQKRRDKLNVIDLENSLSMIYKIEKLNSNSSFNQENAKRFVVSIKNLLQF